MNKEINIRVAPNVGPPPISVLNSLCKVSVILTKKMYFFEGIIQNKGVSSAMIIRELSQFKGKLKSDDGSNLENKFAIIFNLL